MMPCSVMNSITQKCIKIMTPNKVHSITVSLSSLKLPSNSLIHKISYANNHCLFSIGNNKEVVLAYYDQSGLNTNEIQSIESFQVKHKQLIDFATCESFSIALLQDNKIINRRLVMYDSSGKPLKEIEFNGDLLTIMKVYLTYEGGMIILQSDTYGLYVKNSKEEDGEFRLLQQFNQRIISLSCGRDWIVVALNNNTIVTFGGEMTNNIEGSTSHKDTPDYLIDHFIKKVVCGSKHCLILCHDGVLFSFGNNTDYQCTNDNKSYISQPYPVIFTLSTNEKIFIVDIACGDTFSIAKSTRGHIFIWGTYHFPPSPTKSIEQTPVLLTNINLINIKEISVYGSSILFYGDTNQ